MSGVEVHVSAGVQFRNWAFVVTVGVGGVPGGVLELVNGIQDLYWRSRSATQHPNGSRKDYLQAFFIHTDKTVGNGKIHTNHIRWR